MRIYVAVLMRADQRSTGIGYYKHSPGITRNVSLHSTRCPHGCKAAKLPVPSADHMAIEQRRCRINRPRSRTLTRRRGVRAESPPPAPVVADLAVGGDVQWSARGPPRRDSAHPVFGAPAATKVVDRQGKASWVNRHM
ncbi:uncharacterized protein LOC142572598 [Dermacentor variabilis]|uniref:uncharacterized protein LOC142572598 n=1 Tax=Dermacentor variabilis TaxID=34621 RepID=UPI003F5CADC4